MKLNRKPINTQRFRPCQFKCTLITTLKNATNCVLGSDLSKSHLHENLVFDSLLKVILEK